VTIHKCVNFTILKTFISWKKENFGTEISVIKLMTQISDLHPVT